MSLTFNLTLFIDKIELKNDYIIYLTNQPNKHKRMDTQTLPLVPFGKYKGEPITTLLNDTKYLDWCKQQEWFQKFPIVYNICVNQTITTSNQNSKTPEHNKLQNFFLKRSFNIEFIKKILRFDKYKNLLDKLYDSEEYKIYYENQRFDTIDYGLESARIKPIFETIFNWDVTLSCDCNGSKIILNPKYYNEQHVIYEKLFKNINHMMSYSFNDPCKYTFPSMNINLYIEIKPLMGDDYPNVLRKMTTQKKITNDKDGIYILLIDEYASSNTSKEQIIQIFRQSHIRVVFISELSNGLPCKIITEQVNQIQDIIHPNQEIINLEDENKLLRETLLQAEYKNKKLEEEIHALKTQKQSKNIKDYFGKK